MPHAHHQVSLVLAAALLTLAVTPTQAQLKKHKDKADEASKDQTIATASINAPAGEWLDIELRTEGEKVTATIGKNAKLAAGDPTFTVAKPTVVFRVIGGDVQLDDVQVTVLKADPVIRDR